MNSENPFYVGVVEDSRTDHLMLGRCKVRVVGLHIQDKAILPTKDLPWATLMSPANSAGVSGIGTSPTGPIEGSTVMVIFNDPPYNQQPVIIGSMQGIPQDEPVINDTLDIVPKFKDDLSEVGRDIPTNLIEAIINQLTPFDPSSFDIPGVLDPFDIMRALKAQMNAFNAVQLTLNIPGVSLTAGFNISRGIYGDVNQHSNIRYYPSDISIYSGAVDNTSLQAGFKGALYGGAACTFTDVNVLVDVVTNGINSSPPIISLKNLPRLFDRYPSTVLGIPTVYNLGLPNIPTPGSYIFPAEVARFKAEVSKAVGIFNQYSTDIEGWDKFAIDRPKTILEFKEWAKNWLLSPCKEVLAEKIIEMTSEYGPKEIDIVNALIEWAKTCVAKGDGCTPGSSLSYTCKAPSLLFSSNLEEVWKKIKGVKLNTDTGKIHGLCGPLNGHGYPTGVTTSCMVIADSVNAAIIGTAVACATYLCKPLDCLPSHAKKGIGVISTCYPAWTIIAKTCDPLKKNLPPPLGMFAEAGNMALSNMISPMADISDKLTSLQYDSQHKDNKIPTCNANGGKNDIPTYPPSWYDQEDRRSQGIQALLAAAKKLGLKTKEQQCSLLAITGGECGWIPCSESHKWSGPDQLMDTFSSVFRGDRKLAERFTNWTGSKFSFFEYVYSCTNHKGKDLGNKKAGDGGKYYGRGFLQLVGRDNYEKYTTISGYNICDNPGLLVSNLTVAAEVAVYYFKDRIQQTVPPTASPGYFEAACSSVTGAYEKEIKRKLYEYFYGIPFTASFQAHIKTALLDPPASCSGRVGQDIVSGRFPASSANTTGFRDPNSKYPLKQSVCKPDSNALARGSTKDTIVPVKEATRTRGIKLPFGKGVLEQPSPPYAAVYPFNHITETESGHIQEFDDTPGAERIHTYHRSGTFTEIDAGGNQVNKIVGDQYTIIDQNGIISVEGKANIHVRGDINIYAQSDVNVQTEGSLHMEVGRDFDLKVARNMSMSVGGKFQLWSTGGNTIHTDKSTKIFSKEQFYNFTIGSSTSVACGNMAIQSDKEMHMFSRGNMYQSSGEGELNVRAASDIFTTAARNIENKAGGIFKADAPVRLGELVGKATSVEAIEADHDKKMRYAPLALPTAPLGNPLSHRQTGSDPTADTGSTDQGQKFHYETPDDYSSPGGQAGIRFEEKQAGSTNYFKGEQGQNPSGGQVLDPVSSNNINNTTDPNFFTNDFRLSTHINLGMMLYPYTPRYHRLVSQNGVSLQQLVNNLVNVSQNILEPIIVNKLLPGGVAGFGKTWVIFSAFRLGINGSPHNKGMAIDFGYPAGCINRKQKTWRLIQQVEKVIDYDQLILEYRNGDCWIHASYDAVQRRRMAFTMNNDQIICEGFKLLS